MFNCGQMLYILPMSFSFGLQNVSMAQSDGDVWCSYSRWLQSRCTSLIDWFLMSETRCGFGELEVLCFECPRL